MKLYKLICALVLFVFTGVEAHAGERLKVVTTLSTFADLVTQVGGDRVDVSSIVAPRFNPHFVEPKPSDILRVKRCALFVHAGLDLEAWRFPLADAAGRPEIRPGGELELDLSVGVKLLEIPAGPQSRSQGDIHLYGNPHYWLDPQNAAVMVEAIAAKLSKLDPSRREEFIARAADFKRRLAERITEWKGKLDPHAGRELVGYHNEWVYLINFSGLRMNLFLEPKPGIPPGPQHLEKIVAEIKKRGITAIVQPSYYPRDAAESVAKRSGAKILTLAQAVNEVPQATDYLRLLNYNIDQLSRN